MSKVGGFVWGIYILEYKIGGRGGGFIWGDGKIDFDGKIDSEEFVVSWG